VGPFAASHGVVEGSFVFDADLAGHGRGSSRGGDLSNLKLVP